MRASFLDQQKSYKPELQILQNEFDQYRFNSTMITISLITVALVEASFILYLLYA